MQTSPMSLPLRTAALACSLAVLSFLDAGGGASPLFAQESAAAGQASPVVPLVAPNQGQKLLALVAGGERLYLRKACQELDVPVEFADGFDARRRDYRRFHAIIVGSNMMDYFAQPEYQVDAAFQPIVDYVAAGGHLIMFATYHGRNMEHLQRFDIVASMAGGEGFVPIPGTTEALFAGAESFVPEDNSLTFLGRTDISRPHVVLLKRTGDDDAVSTVPYGSGRVSITMVEPGYANDLWLYRVMLTWHLRGAPSRLVATGFAGIPWDQTSDPRHPVPDEKELATLTATVQEDLAGEYARLRPWNPVVGKEVARVILAQADEQEDPARRFALFSEARDLAVKSGNAALLFNVIEACGRQYQTDPLQELVDSLDECATQCRTMGDSRTVAYVAMLGTTTAIERQRFDNADKLLATASRSARRSRLRDLITEVADMRKALTEAKSQ